MHYKGPYNALWMGALSKVLCKFFQRMTGKNDRKTMAGLRAVFSPGTAAFPQKTCKDSPDQDLWRSPSQLFCEPTVGKEQEFIINTQ